ncbi:MAG TPA: sugar phosphate nucleotidyltransferase [Candidatus Angelobacter sp.]
MILAAGLGTRLRPLTDVRPKALVEVAGRTLLEITLTRLRSFGITEVIVNAHHFAGMILNYLKANNDFGMRIEVSREDVLLDTGGGLKKAAWFFLEGPEKDEPFILHNVDVISSIDLRRMTQFHREHEALATLAVQQRKTSRDLVFDAQLQLCDHRAAAMEKAGAASAKQQALSFCGIHVISPRLFSVMAEDGVFSIITTYLNLAALGEKILAFRADEYSWRDVGKLESLNEAAREMKLSAGS